MRLLCLSTFCHNYMLHVQEGVNTQLLFKIIEECTSSFYEHFLLGGFQSRPKTGEYPFVFDKREGYSVHHSIITEQNSSQWFFIIQRELLWEVDTGIQYLCVWVYAYTYIYALTNITCIYTYMCICVRCMISRDTWFRSKWSIQGTASCLAMLAKV